MNTNNPLIDYTDSYKSSHWYQMPNDLTQIYSYMEARGVGEYPSTILFGLDYYLKKLSGRCFDQNCIDHAADIYSRHGVSFNIKGWTDLLRDWNGCIPIEVEAVPEGLLVPNKNVLLSVKSLDPKYPWLTSFFEPIFLNTWFPSTVATQQFYLRRLIKEYEYSGTPENVDYKIQDFGRRGAQCLESAQLSGMAHLLSFNATSSVCAIEAALSYGLGSNNLMPFPAAIDAAEHTCILSWGPEGEFEYYKTFLDQAIKRRLSVIAVVIDTYDVRKALDWWIDKAEYVEKSGVKVLLRLDSGDPVESILWALNTLDSKLGSITLGDFRVPNVYRLIQGDGINPRNLEVICNAVVDNYYSIDSIGFGMGGGMVNNLGRDTQGFTFKTSRITRNNVDINVHKQAFGKVSKEGELALVYSEGKYFTQLKYLTDPDESVMQPVFRNGRLLNQTNFSTIKHRVLSN